MLTPCCLNKSLEYITVQLINKLICSLLISKQRSNLSFARCAEKKCCHSCHSKVSYEINQGSESLKTPYIKPRATLSCKRCRFYHLYLRLLSVTLTSPFCFRILALYDVLLRGGWLQFFDFIEIIITVHSSINSTLQHVDETLQSTPLMRTSYRPTKRRLKKQSTAKEVHASIFLNDILNRFL